MKASDPQHAADSLQPELYRELREIAELLFRREREAHTLQPTALVHEAWMRLASGERPGNIERTRLLAIASQLMRRLLVDHARRRSAQKRGGSDARVTFDEQLYEPDEPIDVLELHEALGELEQLHARQAQIVEMRYFGGLTVREVARVLHVSVSTIEEDWRMARAWLTVRLGGAS